VIKKKVFITIAITGIPGSGKTFASQIFQKILGDRAKIFSADKIISDIYQDSKKTRELFAGFDWYEDVLDQKTKSQINKKSLIKKIIKHPEILKDLEEKFHPIVRAEFLKSISENKDFQYLIFEVPLLFEASLDGLFDFNITIESNKDDSFKRAKEKISEELNQIFLESHFSQEKKKNLGSHFFFNDSNDKRILEKQINKFIKFLKFD
jgi:dephospho-CoA kinase